MSVSEVGISPVCYDKLSKRLEFLALLSMQSVKVSVPRMSISGKLRKAQEPRASRSDLGRRSAMEEMNARMELREEADDAYFSLEGLNYWTYYGSTWD